MLCLSSLTEQEERRVLSSKQEMTPRQDVRTGLSGPLSLTAATQQLPNVHWHFCIPFRYIDAKEKEQWLKELSPPAQNAHRVVSGLSERDYIAHAVSVVNTFTIR